jgi:succinyl-diaminopimelate desuccinylase
MNSSSAIDHHLDASLDAMIDLQEMLTAIPAISPETGGDGETRKADALTRRLTEWRLGPVQDFPADDPRVSSGKRPNLMIKRQGRDESSTLWIATHIDIVPEGELSSWTSPPFTLRREDGMIFGRGTEDNQQGLVASLFAFKTLVDLEILPARNIGCLFVADEETGSRFGAQHLLENHADLFGPRDVFLVPDSGEARGRLIEVAEKSVLWAKITTTGRQCHASRPYKGKNAFAAASELAGKIHDLYQVFPDRDELFDPPHSTFEPTRKEANVPNINTIPGHDVFYVDCRVMPGIRLDDVMEWLKEQARLVASRHGVAIAIEPVQYEPAAPPTPANAPLVKALQDTIREVYHEEGKPMGIGGGTVAAHFRKKGFHSVVWSRVDEVAHQPNEYCRLPNLVGDAKVFARMFARF